MKLPRVRPTNKRKVNPARHPLRVTITFGVRRDGSVSGMEASLYLCRGRGMVWLLDRNHPGHRSESFGKAAQANEKGEG
jgi:hypothetical protein